MSSMSGCPNTHIWWKMTWQMSFVHRRHGRLCGYLRMWHQECGQVDVCPRPHQHLTKSVSSHLHIYERNLYLCIYMFIIKCVYLCVCVAQQVWIIWKATSDRQSSLLLVACLCRLSENHFWVRFKPLVTLQNLLHKNLFNNKTYSCEYSACVHPRLTI